MPMMADNIFSLSVYLAREVAKPVRDFLKKHGYLAHFIPYWGNLRHSSALFPQHHRYDDSEEAEEDAQGEVEGEDGVVAVAQE